MSANETVVVTSPLGEGKLSLRTLTMSDALSRAFEVQLVLSSPDFEIDFDKLLGAGLGVEIAMPNGRKRCFHGQVAHVELAGAAPRAALYQVSLRPWLWLLSHTADCRIFQHKSVPEIVKQIFADKGFSDFEDKLSATYAKREYCVQYCESDFNFVCRLMEDEGIYFYFKHSKNKHTLVLCDSTDAHASAAGYGAVEYRPQRDAAGYPYEAITEWREAREVAPGACILSDFDFEKPKTNLEARSCAPAAHQHAALEVFDYPGSYAEVKRGEAYAKIRREALQTPSQRFFGEGNPRGVGAGHTFRLTGHPRDALNKEYLVIAAEHELLSTEHELGATRDTPSYRLSSRLRAIDSKRPFRPPRLTPATVIRGPQTAIVVGPSSGEMHTDKYGRVKVKFPWDRHGKSDETASCWLRVSQGWAGKTWGQFFLPRIGQEVIVDFLDGDPDRPLVTGRVYNADQMPPYALPDNQTRSTIKTRSSPKGDEGTFNELRFEDKKGAEEIYLHAERDFNRVVENNDTLKIGFDKKAEGNQSVSIWNNRSTTLANGDDTLKIDKGKRTATIMGDDAVTVTSGDQNVKIEAGSQSTEAMKSITLKVGQNSIIIDQSGITIKAIQVKVEAQVAVAVKGLMVQVQAQTTLDLKGLLSTFSADAVTTVKGAMVMVN